MPLPPTSALDDIATERQRQIAMEGWSHEHDDQHRTGDLAKAAACYATCSSYAPGAPQSEPPELWPWAHDWWKPEMRRKNLVRAGALILAEIEREDRMLERTKIAMRTPSPGRLR